MCADLLGEAGCGRVPWLHAGTFGLDPGKAEGFSMGSVPRKLPEFEGRVQRVKMGRWSLACRSQRGGGVRAPSFGLRFRDWQSLS